MKITNISIVFVLLLQNLAFAALVNTNMTNNFSKKDLTLSNMAKKSLENANFSNSNISFGQFSSTNLKNAILVEINAERTQFASADLSGVIAYKEQQQKHANFSEANFVGANLTTANMSKTRLYRANFFNANLSKVIFNEANMVGTILKNANVSGALFKDVPIAYNGSTKIFTYIANINDLKNIGAIWDNNNPPKVECTLCNKSGVLPQTQKPTLRSKK